MVVRILRTEGRTERVGRHYYFLSTEQLSSVILRKSPELTVGKEFCDSCFFTGSQSAQRIVRDVCH